MLRITLYENCILNNDYDEVFSVSGDDTNNTLERYLATLRNKVFELDTVYQENSGTLVFDMIFEPPRLRDIYHYNYMKVETITGTSAIDRAYKRYCFIDKIRLKNDVVYLDYSEDIWSSYSDKINGITNSFVENSRIVEYKNNHVLEFRGLPVPYGGNNGISQFISRISPQNYTKVGIVAEIQYYVPVSQGQPTETLTQLFLIYDGTDTLFFINDAIEICAQLQKNAQKSNALALREEGIDKFYSYQINKFYLIPMHIMMLANFINLFVDYNDMQITWDTRYKGSSLLTTTAMYELVSGTINNDFRIKSFGTFTNQFQVSPNGTTIPYKILISISKVEMHLLLDFNEEINEITEDFVFELPYSYYASEIVAQQKINRAMKNVSNSLQDAVATIDIIRSINKQISGAGHIAGSAMTNSMSGIFSGAEKLVSGKLDEAESMVKKVHIARERALINAEVFNTATKVKCQSNALINAYYGLVYYKISNDNYRVVESAVNYSGFKTYELFTDYDDLGFNDGNEFLNRTVPINFNSIKFSKINLYGRFTNEIANKLEDILLGGTTIWFDENRSMDNYLSQVL